MKLLFLLWSNIYKVPSNVLNARVFFIYEFLIYQANYINYTETVEKDKIAKARYEIETIYICG